MINEALLRSYLSLIVRIANQASGRVTAKAIFKFITAILTLRCKIIPILIEFASR
jgi:hypothetical protein